MWWWYDTQMHNPGQTTINLMLWFCLGFVWDCQSKLYCRDIDNKLQSAVDRGLIEKYQWETHQLVKPTETPKKLSFDWEKINLGILHKIIKKMLSCVEQNYRTGQFCWVENLLQSHLWICPGIFFFISLILGLISLLIDLSLYLLLYFTGFFWSNGIFLLGSKVLDDYPNII